MKILENIAVDYYDPDEGETKYELINGKICGLQPYEIIGGEKIIMSPAPTATHASLVVKFTSIFDSYIWENNIKGMVFGDNVDIYLSQKEHYKPDVSVILNTDIIDWNGAIHGAPDLIVEVLSESTKKNDFGIKKDAYEKYGVKEYWIVDPKNRSIKVYHLIEGKFKISGEYNVNGDKTEIKVSIFEDLVVDIRKVFKWWLN